MKTLINVIDANTKIKTTMYNDDYQYLKDSGINNTVIKSALDVDMLISVVDSMDKIHSQINKYEAWFASEFDHHYGWDSIPDRYVRQFILDALDKFKVLYVKVIDGRILNLYSADTTDRKNIVVSFSVMSD